MRILSDQLQGNGVNKMLRIVVVIFALLAIFSIQVEASTTSIIDQRCRREKLLLDELKIRECSNINFLCDISSQAYSDSLMCKNKQIRDCQGPSCQWNANQKMCEAHECFKYCYSQYCCIEGNTEKKMKCLEEYFSGSSAEFGIWGAGGFNLFGTDVVLSCNTIPVIIKAGFALFFGIFGLVTMVTTMRGLQKWLHAAFSKEDTESAKKYFTNGAIGVLVTVGGILIVGIVFRAAGYKGNIFDFSEDMDRLCHVDCSVMDGNEEECKQYDWSCTWFNHSSECHVSANINNQRMFDAGAMCDFQDIKVNSDRNCPEVKSKF